MKHRNENNTTSCSTSQETNENGFVVDRKEKVNKKSGRILRQGARLLVIFLTFHPTIVVEINHNPIVIYTKSIAQNSLMARPAAAPLTHLVG